MSDRLNIIVDGSEVTVEDGVTVAAALLSLGTMLFRRDSSGSPRAPLCGMGTCFECRVTIDGVPESRACLVSVKPGMLVETGL